MTGGRASEPIDGLRAELEDARRRLAEAERTLQALSNGSVDALVVPGANGPTVYTRSGAEAPYRALVEQMRQGALTVDSEGVILYANQRLAETLKSPLNELIGSPLARFVISDDDRARLTKLISVAAESPSEAEMTLGSGGAAEVPALVSMNAFRLDGEQPTICGVVTDLREQMRRQAIVEAEQLARLILDQAAEAIVVVDVRGEIVRASYAARGLAGCDVTGLTFDEAFQLRAHNGCTLPEGIDALDQESLLRSARELSRVRGLEVVLHQPKSDVWRLLLSYAALRDASDEFSGVVVTLTDITARSRAEQAMRQAESSRALATGLLKGQEDERKRVAREIHDGLSQELVVIAVSAGALREELPEEVLPQLDRLEGRIAELSEQLRRVSHGLHPSILEHVGLPAALRGIGDEFKRHSAIKVSVEAQDGIELDPDHTIAFYRIVQEALRNVERHSSADNVAIRLLRNGACVRLEISDDGKGFDIAQRSGVGLGLASMCERAGMLGGRLDVLSKTGAGTTIRLSVNVNFATNP